MATATVSAAPSLALLDLTSPPDRVPITTPAKKKPPVPTAPAHVAAPAPPPPLPPPPPPTQPQGIDSETYKAALADTHFLRTLVDRLSAELAHAKRLDNSDPLPDTHGSLAQVLLSGKATWLSDAKRLAPLFTCLDEHVKEVTDKLAEYERQVPQLVHRCESLAAENERLATQLDTMHMLRDKDKHQPTPAPASTSAFSSDQITSLIAQNHTLKSTAATLHTHLAHRDKDIATLQSQLRTSQSQTSALRQSKRDLESQVAAAAADVAALESELAASDRRATVAEHECGRLQVRVVELEAGVADVSGRFQASLADAQVGAARVSELLGVVQGLEAELVTERAAVASIRRDLDQVVSAQAGVETRAASLEVQVKQYSERESKLVARQAQVEREAVEARRERDNAQASEEQARREAVEMKKLIDDVLPKSVSRSDMDKALREHAEVVERMTDELTRLTAANAKLSAEVERAVRDRRMADDELRRANKLVPEECNRVAGVVDELTAKLRAVERERGEAVHQLQLLQRKLERIDSRHEQEQQTLASELSHVQKRASRMEREVEETKEANLKLLSQLHDASSLESDLRKQLDHARRQLESTTQQWTHKYASAIQDLESQLADLRQAYTSTCKELSAGHAQAAATRAQSKASSASLVQDYDTVVHVLRDKLGKTEAARDEAVRQIKAVKARAEREVEREREARREVAAKLVEAKRRIDELSVKLAEAVRAAAGLAREKRMAARRTEEAVRMVMTRGVAGMERRAGSAGKVVHVEEDVLVGRKKSTKQSDPTVDLADRESLAIDLELQLQRIKAKADAREARHGVS